MTELAQEKILKVPTPGGILVKSFRFHTAHTVGGIAFLRKDLPFVQSGPGFVTDLQMNRIVKE